MTNEMQTKQNIWDNLQVEVTAAFNPIKLPLKQLKEMDQGLVVEVGDLMDNRVLIEVEGHPVAWGELLVIGDKFGVRIQGLHDAVEYVDHTSSAVTPMTAPATPTTSDMPLEQSILPAETPQNTLMDFDLDESDFEDADDDEDWA